MKAGTPSTVTGFCGSTSRSAVAENIVDASFEALNDSIVYKLLRAGVKAA